MHADRDVWYSQLIHNYEILFEIFDKDSFSQFKLLKTTTKCQQRFLILFYNHFTIQNSLKSYTWYWMQAKKKPTIVKSLNDAKIYLKYFSFFFYQKL